MFGGMRTLSAAGRQQLDEIGARHGFGAAAVATMLDAVLAGHGRMAQFRHPEFGGSGQWMRGGMTMVSDMFNATLKGRVEQLCASLADFVATPEFFEREAVQSRVHWWPHELGEADSAGAQNGRRYAYFAAARRLATDIDGRIVVYDTQDHRIGGVAQQQSASASLTFRSQHGIVDVATLPVVSDTRESTAGSGAAVTDG